MSNAEIIMNDIKDLEGSVDVFFGVHMSCAGGQKLHVTLPPLPTSSP
jgi:hypothetical protein